MKMQREESSCGFLVIEDERDLCEDVAKKLRLSGYEADTCFTTEKRRWSCWR